MLSVTSTLDTADGELVNSRSKIFEPLVGEHTNWSRERSCTILHSRAAFWSLEVGDTVDHDISGTFKSPQMKIGEFAGKEWIEFWSSKRQDSGEPSGR